MDRNGHLAQNENDAPNICTFVFLEIPVVHNPGRNVMFLVLMAFVAVVAGIKVTQAGVSVDWNTNGNANDTL